MHEVLQVPLQFMSPLQSPARSVMSTSIPHVAFSDGQAVQKKINIQLIEY
jgi:hypothetical protein